MTLPKDTTIVEVLDQSVEAAEQIRSVSSELEVVHAVLSTQITKAELGEEVPAAVERTEELAQQLAETAEALDRSNELLRDIKANSIRQSDSKS